MSHDWFKMHNDFINDPKMKRYFSKSERLDWVNLLCLSSKSKTRGVVTLPPDEIAYALDLEDDEWDALLWKFIDRRMVEVRDDGAVVILNWTDRQYEKPSDAPEATAERQRKSRAARAQANVSRDVTRCHATDTDTDKSRRDTETNNDPLPPAPDEPTNSLSDTAPSRRRGSDFGVYVENILSEADRNPDRAHWRQALADEEAAKIGRGDIIRNPGAFRKDRLDRWVADPASRPLPPAPLNGPAAPRRLTPSEQRQREIAAQCDANYAADMARLNELMPDDPAESNGDFTTTPPLRIAAGGFAV